jgi:glycosyltransferase involved in cell wall biosynthesis
MELPTGTTIARTRAAQGATLSTAATGPTMTGMGEGSGRLTVMHVSTSLEVGGAERMLSRLAPALDHARWRTVVVSLKSLADYGGPLRASGIEVVTLELQHRFAAGVRTLWRTTRELRPDLVQGWMYHGSLMATLARRAWPRAALAWNLRGAELDWRTTSLATRAVVTGLGVLSRGPELIVSNSEAGERFHRRLGYAPWPARWRVIPNGFETGTLRPDAHARAAVRAELGVAEGVPLLGTLARWHAMKDHRTLLAALRTVTRPFHLLLAGTATDSPEAAAVVAEHGLSGCVSLLGQRADSARLMAALDLHVLSSSYGEGFPNVVGEAMACGVPCVATTVGDAEAIIGDCGAAVPPRDPAALAQAIVRLLALTPAERAALGERARRRVIDRWSLPAVVARYDHAWREAIDARRDG